METFVVDAHALAWFMADDWEIHDRIISATARYYRATLITRDDVLQDYEEIETVW